MNIIVKPCSSDICYCRPDTTWERENKDFYSPECVNEVLWAPVVFARISKAGKCIGNKFADRYYDAIGCGMLMYGNNDLISCIDHTSRLPLPMYSPLVLDEDKSLDIKVTRLGKEGDEVHTFALSRMKKVVEETICKASQLTSLRIGDLLAIELTPLESLADRSIGDVSVQGTFSENEIFEFKVIF